MASDTAPDVKFEIGHVLFIDIVGYSQLLITQQSEYLETLRRIVGGTAEFRAAAAEGKLLRLPTGDGAALVFRTTPEAPVLCALEIARELKKYPELRVRMGIHSGPVNAITDLNEQANIAGAGINIAQRVMDCGDAGHILLSKHVAEDLEHYPRWKPYLHDLGECEVKHGVRVSVVNLYTDDAGNTALPARLAAQKRSFATGKRFAGFRTLMLAAIIFIGLGVPAIIFTPAILKSLRSPTAGDKALSSSIPAKSIAVLPFENLSQDKGATYFADGIQDQILTKLASIADLKVISRTSTAKYKSKPEDLKIVSQQLGVANVLEGTVQKAGDKVRVNVQLIDARADSHLWAKTYDRDIQDIFAVQSEVAQEVADSLKAKLSPVEANTVATAPTKDAQAYDLFLKGEFEQRVANSNFRSESFDQAARWYKEAIARDPNFALAMAQLAMCQLRRHWLTDPLSESELMETGRLAKQALTLAPDLAEAHVAVGLFHYYGFREYEQALAEFQRALQIQPNNALALSFVAFVHRRQGKWDLTLEELKRSIELDPRNPYTLGGLAETDIFLRRWKEAEEFARSGLTIDPHESTCMRMLLLSSLNQTGNAQAPLRLLAIFPPDDLLIPNTGTYDIVIGTRGEAFVLGRDFKAALKTWATGTASTTNERQRLAAKAMIRLLAGDIAGAKPDADKARELLEARLREDPNDFRSRRALSWVYLALNRKTDAVNIAQQAVELLPLEKDAVLGSGNLGGLAEIQARTGATAEAVENLKKLLSIPAGETVSIARLKVDPVWDPIRNHPGFQQLLAGTEQIGPNK
jgi:TolB-like protein/Tfp pilus assembly protein PilF/class 3 adenylate cyclase